MSIGVSLPCEYLCGAGGSPAAEALTEACGPAEVALPVLHRHGVRSIEVRHFPPDTPSRAVVEAVRHIWQAGCAASLHPATPPGCEVGSLPQVFPWLPETVGRLPGRQTDLLLTLHACAGADGDLRESKRRTEAMFVGLAQLAEAEDLPLRFALELNRFKGAGDPSTSYRSVADMHAAIGRPRVGICWDWGHTQANVAAGLMRPEPSPAFLRGVIHTHIHDLGPTGATHWPLGAGGVPLEQYAAALRGAGYRGVYCLELSPERFHHQIPVDRALRESIRLLSEALADDPA